MNFSEYFYQNWLDKLVTVIGVIIGVVGGVSILIAKIGECIKTFKVCSDDVKERGKELMQAKEKVDELNGKINETFEKLDSWSEESINLLKRYKELQSKVERDNNAIKSALTIAFSADSELVKQGKAQEICKILKGEEDEERGELST